MQQKRDRMRQLFFRGCHFRWLCEHFRFGFRLIKRRIISVVCHQSQQWSNIKPPLTFGDSLPAKSSMVSLVGENSQRVMTTNTRYGIKFSVFINSGQSYSPCPSRSAFKISTMDDGRIHHETALNSLECFCRVEL